MLDRHDIDPVLLRGSMTALVVNVIGISLGSVVQIPLIRMMGAEQYGIFEYVLAWIVLALPFVRLGFDRTVLRYLAAYNGTEDWALMRGILRRSNQIVLIVSLVSAGIFSLVIWALRTSLGSELTWTFWIGCLVVPPLALLGLRQATLRSLKRILYSQILDNVLRRLLFAGLVAFAFVASRTAVRGSMAMVLYAVSTVSVLGVATFWQSRTLPSALRFVNAKYSTKAWLRVSLPLLLTAGMASMSNKLGVILIGTFVGTTEAGIYSVAWRLAILVTIGLKAANSIASPTIAELYASGKTVQLQRSVTLSAWGAAIISAGIAASLILGGDFVLGILGQEYIRGTSILTILVIGMVVSVLVGPAGELLSMTGYQDVHVMVFAVSLAVHVAFAIPALIWWGIEGAAIATSAVLAARRIWTWYLVRKNLGINASVFAFRPLTIGSAD